jgi:UDP:flavonoid glycosyltransferase YjiC (YdhE family)
MALSSGDCRPRHEDEPRCFLVGSVPFEQLFPRGAAVVHHGGAGTVAAAVRAGIPQVVVPQMADRSAGVSPSQKEKARRARLRASPRVT